MGRPRRRWSQSLAPLWGGIFGVMGAHACGGEDRPDLVPSCEEGNCVPGILVPSGRTAPPDDGVGGTGGVIEEAPPAGAPAEGLGVEGTLVPPGDIGVRGTVGVDGVQRAPPGVTQPGGRPALPGPPDVELSPPPGAAVDPVTGLEPPRTGVGVTPGTVVVVPGQPVQPVVPTQPVVPQREPTEEQFTF